MTKNPRRSPHDILATAAAICLAALLAVATVQGERGAAEPAALAFGAAITSR